MSNCTNQAQVEKLKLRLATSGYDYVEDDVVNSFFELALTDYIMIKYPSANNRPTRENVVFDYICSDWIYKRMLDILGRAGGISATAYKENNLNLTYGASYIDPELYSLITPNAGVPRWE